MEHKNIVSWILMTLAVVLFGYGVLQGWMSIPSRSLPYPPTMVIPLPVPVWFRPLIFLLVAVGFLLRWGEWKKLWSGR